MKRAKVIRRLKAGFWVLLLAGYSVAATGVMVQTLGGDRTTALSQVASTTSASSLEARMAGAAQVAAVYRAQSGAPLSTLPPGSVFRIVWPDGSSEYVSVVSQASGLGVRPVTGTQLPAPQALRDAPVLDVRPTDLLRAP